MQTFVARSRRGLAAVESDMADRAAQQAPMIQRTLAGAPPPEIEAELRMYIDERMPFVTARAKLAAVVATEQRPTLGWYKDTDKVRVIQAAKHRADVRDVGARPRSDLR
ncbi:MAG: hypothetical protein ABIY55_07780 [Kofleriaceae bacterium]